MPIVQSPLTASPADDPLAASLAALRHELEIDKTFPADVEAEAEQVAAGPAVDGSDEVRTDLRAVDFLTIDPSGARDLDQALHIQREGSGFVVRYAIADLAAVIRPGGAIDLEAQRRGQTLYAPDVTVPLHPERLSADACSLLPGADRRAYVWTFHLDEEGHPSAAAEPPDRAWVASRAQWTYADAQRGLEQGTAPQTLQELATLGPLRIAQEAARGGASLNSPEQEVEKTDTGYTLVARAPLPVEQWNAQISLLTGMAAAEIMIRQGAGILRTMPPADDEAISELRRRADLIGIPWSPDQSYGDYLRALDTDDARTPAVIQAAAALFRGATYVPFLATGELPEHVEQSAIAAPYAHTTAPLRRLVDRFVLRAVTGDVDREVIPRLPDIMRDTSAVARDLERGALDRIEAAILSDRVGSDLDAVVVSSGEESSRVQIVDPFVIATVAGSFHPGTRVRVTVTSTDVATGMVSLSATT